MRRWAIALGLLLLAANVAMVFAAMSVTGFLNGPGDVTMFTLRQRRTDPAWFGRAFAVSSSFNFSGYPLGAAVAGAIVGYALQPAIALAALMAILSGVFAWSLIPHADESNIRTK